MPRLIQPSLLRRSAQSQGFCRVSDCASACSSQHPADASTSGCRCPVCRGSIDQTGTPVVVHRHLSSWTSGCGGTTCSCSACQSKHAISSKYSVEQALQQTRGVHRYHFSQGMRQFSTTEDYLDKVDAINDAFVEARDEIEYAKEDSETVYFNEAHETAKAAVSNTLSMFEELLAELSKPDAEKLQRSMGMKMQQLKAELLELDELHA